MFTIKEDDRRMLEQLVRLLSVTYCEALHNNTQVNVQYNISVVIINSQKDTVAVATEIINKLEVPW